MELHITLAAPADLSGQIYRQVREAILDGRLRPGEPLPPTRELAERLQIARNTVLGRVSKVGVSRDMLRAWDEET